MGPARLLKSLKVQTRLIKKQMAEAHLNLTRKRVHELRITTRRIRATLWLMEHSLPRMDFGKSSSELRKLGRSLGDVRELDVAIRDADDYQIKTGKMKKDRKAARQDLLKQTNSRHRKKIANHLDLALSKLSHHPELMIHSGTTSLEKRIQPWMRKALKTEEDFHQLRILTKKTRYSLESLGKSSRPLCDLQDVLGKGHDLEVLQSFAKDKSRLQDDTRKEYERARRLAKPALRFALKQLSVKKKH